MSAGVLGRFALGAQQRGVQHVVHERRFAGAADAGHADQPPQRNVDVDIFEVVLRRAFDAQRARVPNRHDTPWRLDALAMKQVIGRQGVLCARQVAERAEKHDLAAALSGTRTDVEQTVGRLQ